VQNSVFGSFTLSSLAATERSFRRIRDGLQSGGSKLGEELWESKAAGNFFGCSNATKQFAGTRSSRHGDIFLSTLPFRCGGRVD
jgi:hypothetical protein